MPGIPLKVSIFFIILMIIFLIIFSFIADPSHVLGASCITLKQWCVPHTNTNTPAIIPTYGRVLSAIKKILQKLMEKYQGVRRSLWDLVEGQKRNTAQLERIRAAMKWRWGSEGENGKEESRDEERGSENSSRESQKEGTPLSAFCQYSGFVFFILYFKCYFPFCDLNV